VQQQAQQEVQQQGRLAVSEVPAGAGAATGTAAAAAAAEWNDTEFALSLVRNEERLDAQLARDTAEAQAIQV